jgi:7-cyano-7-deazaguanine reductase
VSDYTEEHARSGIEANLPDIECWPNQYPGYDITISIPEFTSICPKTGLPDFGLLSIEYEPDALCLELKSLKSYFIAYRDLGIFYENVVNRVLKDLVAACSPVRAEVTGEFNARGGMKAVVKATFKR